MTPTAAPDAVQVLRLRLPGVRRPVHVLREIAAEPRGGFWTGADLLFSAVGAVRAAHSRSRLLDDYYSERARQPQTGPVLVVDATRCRRALSRPHQTWSGTVRGTLVDVDDLLWDAAASVDDTAAGEAVRDPEGFHAQYLYVWGDRAAPLQTGLRLAHWDTVLAWLLRRLDVVDGQDRTLLKRR